MARLVPAILTREAEEVYELLDFLEKIPGISEVQIDFADGEFVTNQTVLPGALLPPKTRLRLEAHLMTRDPQQYFDTLEHLGFGTVIVHYESFVREIDLLAALKNAKHVGLAAGVAINPGTAVEVLERLVDEIAVVLLMGVYPGYQGQKFLPQTFERLQKLHKSYPKMIVELDGGINLDNCQRVLARGANRLVVGSAIWQTPDAKKTILEFLKKCEPQEIS